MSDNKVKLSTTSSSIVTTPINFQQIGLTKSNIDFIITSTRHTIFDEFFNLLNNYKGDDLISRDNLLLKVLNITNDLNEYSLITEQLNKWEIEKHNFISKETERLSNEKLDKSKYDDNNGDDDWNEFINYPERMKYHKKKEGKQNANTRNRFLNSINNIDNINIQMQNIITQMDSSNTKLDKILTAIVDLKIEKNDDDNEVKKEDEKEEPLSVVVVLQEEHVIHSSISEKEIEIVKEESIECNSKNLM
jgi:hypothetical protein